MNISVTFPGYASERESRPTLEGIHTSKFNITKILLTLNHSINMLGVALIHTAPKKTMKNC